MWVCVCVCVCSQVVFPCICMTHLASRLFSRELKGRTLTATFTEAAMLKDKTTANQRSDTVHKVSPDQSDVRVEKCSSENGRLVYCTVNTMFITDSLFIVYAVFLYPYVYKSTKTERQESEKLFPVVCSPLTSLCLCVCVCAL